MGLLENPHFTELGQAFEELAVSCSLALRWSEPVRQFALEIDLVPPGRRQALETVFARLTGWADAVRVECESLDLSQRLAAASGRGH